MEKQLRQFFIGLSKSRGISDIQINLPLEETKFAYLIQSDQWRNLMQKYFRNALQRGELSSQKRINFELMRKDEKKLKL